MGKSTDLPTILYIDAYDSFANNIIVLLKRRLNAKVKVIQIDDSRFSGQSKSSFFEYVRQFDAVVAGPGPGTPERPEDVGLIAHLWTLSEEYAVPVLGICLGFQSLVLSSGGSIYRLNNPQHGVITHVVHSNRSIFKGVGDLQATQYNSLAAELGKSRENLQPLAYHRLLGSSTLILSAVRHRHVRKPFWGVQFHPESVCTNAAGTDLVRNWWHEALEWNRTQRQTEALHSEAGYEARATSERDSAVSLVAPAKPQAALTVQYECITNTSTTLGQLRDFASSTGASLLLLESVQQAPGVPINSETGRFTIAGFCNEDTKRTLYFTGASRIETRNGRDEILDERSPVDLWKYLEGFMNSVRPKIDGDVNSPFWGGLMGFVSYEAGLTSFGVEGASQSVRPDVCFAFVERSIVVDNVEERTWIQSIKSEDDKWLAEARATIAGVKESKLASLERDPTSPEVANISFPTREDYIESIRSCKEEIRAGNSYELCLTTEATASLPTSTSRAHHSWELYERLRELNGSPFAAYMRFGIENSDSTVSVISSSPERFLSWDRKGRCQFRPIKGTLKKTPDMTRGQAEQYFLSAKERAENLMIVDLIRHDLNGVIPIGEAQVTKLMSVEEYATVYQLVSVIEGDLSPQSDCTTGIHVLATSLPPGSMTGAPKKRSCELLNRIEQSRARGVYSGVLGYLDVGGGGDFSVAIRTAFSWDHEQRDGHDLWHVGAGGAITAQSDEGAEYAEMLTKLEAVLGIFD